MHTLSSAKSLLKLSKLTKILLHVYVYHLPPPPEANPSESVLRAASQLWSGMTRIIFVKFNKKKRWKGSSKVIIHSADWWWWWCWEKTRLNCPKLGVTIQVLMEIRARKWLNQWMMYPKFGVLSEHQVDWLRDRYDRVGSVQGRATLGSRLRRAIWSRTHMLIDMPLGKYWRREWAK